MSLKPFSAHVVPERTASVARMAFPAGSLCIRVLSARRILLANSFWTENQYRER
jgi:hypothetical protein